jgi:hypothetical protein
MNGNRLCCKSLEWFTMYDDNLAFKQHIRDRGLSHHSPNKIQLHRTHTVAGEIPNDPNLISADGRAVERRT